MNGKVLIIVNTGTPDSPDLRNVRRYLSEFLNDRRVIDLPWLLRKFLVNLIIVPFRAPRSTKKYRKLWTDKGSPLLNNMHKLVSKLSDRLKNEYVVIGVMRYGNPSLEKVFDEMIISSPDSVVVFPMYPHYSSSTTGSVNELFMRKLMVYETIPELKLTGQFYNHPSYIESVAYMVRKFDLDNYDHILFSYHGLPVRQIQKVHPEINIDNCNCETRFPPHGNLCYKATCFETTRLLAEKLNLNTADYSTSFQSRFSRNWLGPFTDSVLKKLASSGKKRVLVVAPSFTADCLETISEVGEDYAELFKSAGGSQLDLVPSLNDEDNWVEAIIKIAEL
ncbi:MAG TPA: ferrochelatase [Bacteroidales bacterium]|nr:ferrochelatase [Bacteroidales bacterium]